MFKPRKVGWSDQGQTDLHESGENCLKYFKRGQKRTEGRRHKDFKKEGQVGSMDECLKKGGRCWNPLMNYAYRKDLSWPRVQEK